MHQVHWVEQAQPEAWVDLADPATLVEFVFHRSFLPPQRNTQKPLNNHSYIRNSSL
jgi:hypothetical protein